MIDLAVLGAGGTSVLLALAAGAGDLSAGCGELVRILRHRSSEPFGNWLEALGGELGQSLGLGRATAPLLGAAWLACLKGRQWRAAALLPAYLLFALVLREYVTVHHFARLPLVFFSLVTLALGVELAIGWLGRGRMWSLALAVALRVSGGHPQSEMTREMHFAQSLLLKMVDDPRLARCNAFEFYRDYRTEHFDPFGRMGQFYFGTQVVERVRQGAPVERCILDFESSEIRRAATSPKEAPLSAPRPRTHSYSRLGIRFPLRLGQRAEELVDVLLVVI